MLYFPPHHHHYHLQLLLLVKLKIVPWNLWAKLSPAVWAVLLLIVLFLMLTITQAENVQGFDSVEPGSTLTPTPTSTLMATPMPTATPPPARATPVPFARW